ncbi:MAG: hypothetical protein BroJett015_37060 [Chloroflexota bacterium]|nr:MAG: hypothetical protein BroJett015_37060 [Chloroflexota bacterium]
MSKFEHVQLAKLIERVINWNPAKEAPEVFFRYIDISSIDRDSKEIVETSSVMGKEAPSRARQLVQAHDVLVSTVRPNLNAVAQVPETLDGGTASTGYCVLRPKNGQLDARYLFHWVKTPTFVENMVLQATGANYPAVTDTVIKSSTIPLPPLGEQQRIAAILDKADMLRAKRRTAVARLDALLQSTFLHLFGDPVTNPMGWEVVILAEMADIGSGVTKGRKFGNQETIFVPYMRVANVQDGEILTDDVKTVEVLSTDVNKYQLEVGDILLTEGGDPDKLGRGAIWHGQIPNCIHQNHIFRVRLKNGEMIPEYLSALIGSSYGKRYFLKAAKQTTGIATINKTQLSQFPVLRPSLELQNQFKRVMGQIQAAKAKHSQHLSQLDNLFHALQQRAFNGQL